MKRSRVAAELNGRPLLEQLESRELFATIVWDGGPNGLGTDFALAANWAGDIAPGPGDTAQIGAVGPDVVVSSSRTLISIQTERHLRIAQSARLTTSGVSFATGRVTIDDGDLVGGSWTISDQLSVTGNSLFATLTNVSISGTVVARERSRLYLNGSTRFTQILVSGGTSNVILGDNYVLHDRITIAVPGTSTTGVSFGLNCQISSSGVLERADLSEGPLYVTGSSTVTSSGIIENRSPFSEFQLRPDTLINLGIIRSIAGRMVIGNSGAWWSNTGLVEATTGGVAALRTGYRMATSSGTLRGVTGMLVFEGPVDNANNTLVVNDLSGSFYLQNNMTGGIVQTSGNATIGTMNGFGARATFTDVQVQGVINAGYQSEIIFAGSTQFDTLRIAQGGVTLTFPAGFTLTGSILYSGVSTSSHVISIGTGTANGALTIGANGRIVAESGFATAIGFTGTSVYRLINQGTIIAQSGAVLPLNLPLIDNRGVVDANAGTVRITTPISASNFSNTGTLRIRNNGAMVLTTYLNNPEASPAILDFGTGTVTFNNAYVNVTDRSFNVGGSGAVWRINDSTMIGGTFTVAGGTDFTVGASTIVSSSNFSSVRVIGSLALTGSTLALQSASSYTLLRMLGNTRLAVANGTPLSGVIEIDGPNPGIRTIDLSYQSSGFFTIGATGVIRALPSSGGAAVIRHALGGALVNLGTISNDSLWSTTITAASFINAGTLSVFRGSIQMNITGNSWIQRGDLFLAAGTVLDLATPAAMVMEPTSLFVTQVANVSSAGRISGFDGVITLGGTFRAMFTANHSVPLFSSITLVTAPGGGAVMGQFSSQEVNGIDNTNKLLFASSSTSYAITMTSKADFNNDLMVDFFDYLDFVQAFASNGTGSDFNGDGTVDLFDYLDFVQIFSEF